MTTTAFDAQRAYIESTSAPEGPWAEALRDSYAHAEEYSLPAPSPAVGQLLSTLTAAATAHAGDKPQAIAITPAASVVGLYLLEGLTEQGILSCIDPEAEHQANAKSAFRTAGYKPGHVRFLPSRPLDVMGRLANDAYQVIYADVPTMDALPLLKASWPLLSTGGTVILANSLLDGTLGDASRADRATTAARELDAFVRTELSSLADAAGTRAVVTRLPLDSGLTLVTKVAG